MDQPTPAGFYLSSSAGLQRIAHMPFPFLQSAMSKLVGVAGREREVEDMRAEVDLRTAAHQAARVAAGIPADAPWKADPPEVLAKLSARLDVA